MSHERGRVPVFRKLIIISSVAALAAAGFGASMAASAGRACVPGTQCGTTDATTTSGRSTTTGTTGTTSHQTTTSTTSHPTIAKPTLKLSAKAIEFGAVLKLSGKVSVHTAGQVVEIFSQSCGFSQPVRIAQAKTRADGSYAFAIQPTLNATYFVRYASLASATQVVAVRPLVQLRRLSGSSFGVDVSVGNGTYFTKSAVLQRYDAARRRWLPLASGKLHPNSDPGAIVAVSSAKVHAAVKSGAKVRATVSQATVGRCYRAGTSPAITT